MTQQRPRAGAPGKHHRPTASYRNIAIPKELHKRIAHISIDEDRSISEIVTELIEKYLKSVKKESV